jgi:hypothetical protein
VIKIGLIILACSIGIGLIVLLVRSRIAPTYSVDANDIPEIISQLKRSADGGHFAVLMFVPPGSTDGAAVNLQYSMDAGIAGLDWVLISPRNVADKNKVREFASGLGFRFEEREMNKVHYLRVTGDHISELGVKIIQDFYKIDPHTKLEMITEGFTWQDSAPRPTAQ